MFIIKYYLLIIFTSSTWSNIYYLYLLFNISVVSLCRADEKNDGDNGRWRECIVVGCVPQQRHQREGVAVGLIHI